MKGGGTIKADGMMGKVMKKKIVTNKLNNGVLIVTKDIPFLRTLTIGIGVKVGSINEENGQFGISHLIEHSVFKGTKNFNSFDLKRAVERYGGIINAFTSEEYTIFEAKVPDFAAQEAFDVLFDLVANPLFPENEIESEKRVVLEEIAMYEDDPPTLSEENLLKSIWGNSPYGRPISGSGESVRALNVEKIKGFFDKNYVSKNLMVVIIGNISALDLDYVEKKMNSIKDKAVEDIKIDPETLEPSNLVVEKKDLNQVSLAIGVPTVKRADKRSYELSLISTILGSGMSSILFERIREKLGLVYSISTSHQSHRFCGEFTISFSTSIQNAKKALEEIKNVLKVLPEGLDEQFEYGKKKIAGRLLMSTESTLATMYMIFDDYFTIGQIREIEDIIGSIESIKKEDLIDDFRNFMNKKWSLSAVGPLKSKEISQNYEFMVDEYGR
jgi:predicted Zn-dependent peptidase